MSDYTKLPRDIADCMKRAGAELSEDQQILLAGYLGPVQEQLEQAQADRDKHRDALESIEWLILRKQAEAVEFAANENRLTGQRGVDYVSYDDLMYDVEQVRKKADELEQNQ